MGNMAQGILNSVIGISIVMAVLYLISVLLELLRFISTKPHEAADEAKEMIPEENFSAEYEYETAAVITAALSAYLSESDADPSGLVVRSIRRVPSWNEASRRDYQRRLY